MKKFIGSYDIPDGFTTTTIHIKSKRYRNRVVKGRKNVNRVLKTIKAMGFNRIGNCFTLSIKNDIIDVFLIGKSLHISRD